MFIKAITSEPRYVNGRRFIEKTVESRFSKGNVSITTTYMNGEPICKKYTFDTPNAIKTLWKALKGYNRNHSVTIGPHIDIKA